MHPSSIDVGLLACLILYREPQLLLSSWQQWLCSVQKTLFHSSFLAALNIFLFLLHDGPWVLVTWRWYRCPICGSALHTLILGMLCISGLIAIHVGKKRLWGAELIFRHRDGNLEGRLILCLFSKRIVVGSPMGPVSCPTMGYWARSTIPLMSFLTQALNPVRKCLVDHITSVLLLYP